MVVVAVVAEAEGKGQVERPFSEPLEEEDDEESLSFESFLENFLPL